MRTEHVVHVYHCVNGMLFCHTPCPCHLCNQSAQRTSTPPPCQFHLQMRQMSQLSPSNSSSRSGSRLGDERCLKLSSKPAGGSLLPHPPPRISPIQVVGVPTDGPSIILGSD